MSGASRTGPSAAPGVVDSVAPSDSGPEVSSHEDPQAGPCTQPKLLKGVHLRLRGSSTGLEKRGGRKSERGRILKCVIPVTNQVARGPIAQQTWARSTCEAHGESDGCGEGCAVPLLPFVSMEDARGGCDECNDDEAETVPPPPAPAVQADCGECANCQDKRAFGGPGLKKASCKLKMQCKHREGGTCCTKKRRTGSDFCTTHGGASRPRCNQAGCTQGALGGTWYCSAHGGGRRCSQDGCTRGAQGGTEYCIAHGGGRRCTQGGCTKGAVGGTDLCSRHRCAPCAEDAGLKPPPVAQQRCCAWHA